MEKEDLLLELYKSIWEGARKKEQITAKYLGIIVSAVGLVVITIRGIAHDGVDQMYLYISVFVAQIIFTWGMLLALEAGYEYRRYQALSSKIEIEFSEKISGKINIFRVIPLFYLYPVRF